MPLAGKIGALRTDPELESVLFVVNPDDPDPAHAEVIVLPESCPRPPDGLFLNPVAQTAYVTRGECSLVQVVDLRAESPEFRTVIAQLAGPPGAALPWFMYADPIMVFSRGRAYLGGVDEFSVWLQAYDADPASPSFNGPLSFTRLPDNFWKESIGAVTGMTLNADAGMLYIISGDQFGMTGLAYLLAVDAETGMLVSGRTLQNAALNNPMVYLPSTDEIVVGIADDSTTGLHVFLEIFPPSTVPTAASTEPTVVTTRWVDVTFDSIQTEGHTTVEPVAAADLVEQVPPQFEIAGEVFEISTTASFSGPITLCFNVASVTDPDVFATLRVLHGENGILVDRTSSHDFVSGTICATVTSLSPFVIARSLEPTYGVVLLYDNNRPIRAGSTVPVRLQITNAADLNLSSASLPVRAVDLRHTSTNATVAVADSGNANTGQTFRFDAGLGGTGGYIFNLQTKDLSSGVYELRFTVNDGQRKYSVPVTIR